MVIVNGEELLELIRTGFVTRQEFHLAQSAAPSRCVRIHGYWFDERESNYYELFYETREPLDATSPWATPRVQIADWGNDMQRAIKDAAETLKKWSQYSLWLNKKRHAAVYLLGTEDSPELIELLVPPHVRYLHNCLTDLWRRGSHPGPALARLLTNLEADFPRSISLVLHDSFISLDSSSLTH